MPLRFISLAVSITAMRSARRFSNACSSEPSISNLILKTSSEIRWRKDSAFGNDAAHETIMRHIKCRINCRLIRGASCTDASCPVWSTPRTVSTSAAERFSIGISRLPSLSFQSMVDEGAATKNGMSLSKAASALRYVPIYWRHLRVGDAISTNDHQINITLLHELPPALSAMMV